MKFKKRSSVSEDISVKYSNHVPNGLIAHTPKGYFYVKGKKRFKFVSDRARISWSLPVVETLEENLAGIVVFGSLGFRDGTLIRDISDNRLYLISDNKRRHITNPDVLLWLKSSIIEVSHNEVLAHDEGDPLHA